MIASGIPQTNKPRIYFRGVKMRLDFYVTKIPLTGSYSPFTSWI